VKGGATREIQTATIEEHTIVVKKREREREKEPIGVLFKEKVIEFCIHQSRSSLCVLSFEILVI
jgi:hypothetical protein